MLKRNYWPLNPRRLKSGDKAGGKTGKSDEQEFRLTGEVQGAYISNQEKFKLEPQYHFHTHQIGSD